MESAYTGKGRTRVYLLYCIWDLGNGDWYWGFLVRGRVNAMDARYNMAAWNEGGCV